jgi:hypothetical protein
MSEIIVYSGGVFINMSVVDPFLERHPLLSGTETDLFIASVSSFSISLGKLHLIYLHCFLLNTYLFFLINSLNSVTKKQI